MIRLFMHADDVLHGRGAAKAAGSETGDQRNFRHAVGLLQRHHISGGANGKSAQGFDIIGHATDKGVINEISQFADGDGAHFSGLGRRVNRRGAPLA